MKTSLKWEKMKIKPAKFKTKNPFNPFAALSQQAVSSAKVKSNRSLSWSLEDDITLHTPLWDQNKYYNLYTPQDSKSTAGNDHTWTGCVATAMAEIMRYHQWPQHPFNLHSYDDNNRFICTENGQNFPCSPDVYQSISPERPAQNYNWNAMPTSSLTSVNDEISRLMQHAGIAVRMDYGYGGSGADGYNYPNPNTVGHEVTDAMTKNFSYRNNGVHFRHSYADDDWKQFLRTDIRQGFPIYYTGYSDGTGGYAAGGHAFVIEGFCSDDGSDYFTFNFGWSGFGNGDFSLDSITVGGYKYTNKQRAIFSLKPNTYRDVFEGDNTYKTSSYTRVGDTQHFHSIDPADDVDWITFYNDTNNVTINIETIANNQTSGSHDTVMYLYDAQGNQLAYNDDGGSSLFSKISKRLYGGRYFIKVIGYRQDSSVSSYDLRVWK